MLGLKLVYWEQLDSIPLWCWVVKCKFVDDYLVWILEVSIAHSIDGGVAY